MLEKTTSAVHLPHDLTDGSSAGRQPMTTHLTISRSISPSIRRNSISGTSLRMSMYSSLSYVDMLSHAEIKCKGQKINGLIRLNHCTLNFSIEKMFD
jgi:hypothetical protein